MEAAPGPGPIEDFRWPLPSLAPPLDQDRPRSEVRAEVVLAEAEEQRGVASRSGT